MRHPVRILGESKKCLQICLKPKLYVCGMGDRGLGVGGLGEGKFLTFYAES